MERANPTGIRQEKFRLSLKSIPQIHLLATCQSERFRSRQRKTHPNPFYFLYPWKFSTSDLPLLFQPLRCGAQGGLQVASCTRLPTELLVKERSFTDPAIGQNLPDPIASSLARTAALSETPGAGRRIGCGVLFS